MLERRTHDGTQGVMREQVARPAALQRDDGRQPRTRAGPNDRAAD